MKNPYGYGITDREVKWLRRGTEGSSNGGFFITSPNMEPRKGYARGWPTKKGIERLLDKGMIYRDPTNHLFGNPLLDPEFEIYMFTARAVHVLARAGGYEVDGQVWSESTNDGTPAQIPAPFRIGTVEEVENV